MKEKPEPASNQFDGMEAICEINDHYVTIRVGSYAASRLKQHPDSAVIPELVRRWNAEPGLREKAKNWDYYQEFCKVNGFQGITDAVARADRAEKLSEACRQALVMLWEELKSYHDEFKSHARQQVENAIAGKLES